MDDLNMFEEMPRSYWIYSTEQTHYPRLEEDIDVDIAIVGGGMVGILAAYQLQNQGFTVAILEAERIAESTTAHTTAKLTSQHDLIYDKLIKQMDEKSAEQYARANETAILEIKKIADENNIACDYIAESSYLFTQDDEYVKPIEDEARAASSLGIKAHLVDKMPLDLDIKSAIVFENQAQFHPRKFLIPLAKVIHQNGISIYEKTRARQLDQVDGRYIINTSQEKKVSADKVIIASHYPFYNKKAMYYSRIYVERSYVIAIKAKEKFPGGIYINAEDPSRSIRSVPTEDGELILVVGETHKTGQGENTNDHYKALLDFAKEIFTVENVLYRWSTQDCMTVDGLPYVGQFSSDTPNLYLATGFHKWGMTNSMASSMILKDLIVKGESPWSDVYDPSRKNILASTKEFLGQNLNVAGQLIDGKASPMPENPEDIVIRRGEGKILQAYGERAGAYRDEDGRVHLVNTTCTHMGCELNWNPSEKSWDCPCHGSRFTYTGEIIQGPAVKNLSFDRDVNTFMKLLKEEF